MKWIYRILRTLMVSLLFLAVGIPIFLYVALWTDPVHERIRSVAQIELSDLLGAKVKIGKLSVMPFTRLHLRNIAIIEGNDTVLRAGELDAGVSGRHLLIGRVVVTDLELMSPDLRLRRDSLGAPLNIQPIISRLSGNGDKQPSSFTMAVNAVIVRNGKASYRIDAAPRKAEGFDVNHISVSDINADLTAPALGNERLNINLKRLTATETSGLYLRNLAVNVSLNDSILSIANLGIKLNNTELSFSDFDFNVKGNQHAVIELLRGSAIYPADLAPIHPALASVPSPVSISAGVELLRDSLVIRKLSLSTPNRELLFGVRGEASRRAASVRELALGVEGGTLAQTIGMFVPLKNNVAATITSLGEITFDGTASWAKPGNVSLGGVLSTGLGQVDIDASLADRRLVGALNARELDLAALLPGKELGTSTFSADFDLSREAGHATLSADKLHWRDHTYTSLNVEGEFSGKAYAATVAVDDSLLRADIALNVDLTPGAFAADIDGDIAVWSPAGMRLLAGYPDHILSGQIKARFDGESPLRPTGELLIDNLRFLNADGEGLREEPIALTTDFTAADRQTVSLRSDLLDLDAVGQIDLANLPATVNNLLSRALPQYFAAQSVDSTSINNFSLYATIHNDAPLLDFLNSDIKLLYPATLDLQLDPTAAQLTASAPYIRKGNSLISSTRLNALLGDTTRLNAATTMPGKFGDMALSLGGQLNRGIGNVTVGFSNNAANLYGGELKLRIKPLADGLDMNVLASNLTLSNTQWNIEPAYVGLRNKTAIVHGFGIVRPGQELTINGVASKFPEDRLIVKLDNINVDYIFQTLQLPETLQFGGDATGTVTASALLSREPILQTDNLYVKGFKYGGCVMGNANIRSRWNNESRGIELYADVDDPSRNGSTNVDGTIFIADKKLDISFLANHTPAAFLHTFMSTWASDIGGTASGNLRLFGTFKDIDLQGDVKAEDFALTVGFTDVTYFATDSVHIRPGVISLNNIRVRDKSGQSGLLNGQLTHSHFKDANFRFRISDFDRMLVLNTRPSTDNDRWYGTIRGSGSMEISGSPGSVSIQANATTSAGSDFNFALTDAQSATEYTFLTFNDVTPLPDPDAAKPAPGSPELDKQMRARIDKVTRQESPTTFDFDLQADVTSAARMNLIMDPNTGDKISGTGTGHIGIHYSSANDEMRLNGEYQIEKGEYNFSLQDIILKKFTIDEGSTIEFNGDPMNARLNINAIYQVNANLSDLDESFLNDKEVQRTNVPVYAVLNLSGQLQDPEISFDLDLPTLSSDVKRKVKAIVSTDDMMNRQIIYLLALNRFYTPEYMAATKGNDLMSVASGTLSSQLSNILGQLSDKISVAPSVRTESGDFSDVEFDLALSSTLLNNRLLLNGNFGYRDKSLNNNQFIGDFDVEYLLTRRGNWRLKAYNHFNDRNLYVKTALTTQGVGIVFKHDFDSLLPKK